MKKWLSTVLIVVVLVLFGALTSFWLQPLLAMAGVAPSVASLGRWVLWGMALFILVLRVMLVLIGRQEAEATSEDAVMSEASSQEQLSTAMAIPLQGFSDVPDEPDEALEDTPVVMSLFQLPAATGYFKGRVNELTRRLMQPETKGLNICGLDGMGKSTLALVLANQIREHYPDGQFFIPMRNLYGGALKPSDVMAQVIHAFRPTTQLPENEISLYTLYLAVLKEKRILFVLDDAATTEQIEPLVPPKPCLLLITSRKNLMLPDLDAIELHRMPPRNAAKVLRLIAPNLEQDADALAEAAAYLPLAVTLAGHAVSHSLAKYNRDYFSVSEYISLLDEVQKRMGPTRTVVTLSYGLLNETLQQAWRTLGLFSSSFNQAAAAAIWQVEQEEAEKRLEELIAYGLLQRLTYPDIPDSASQNATRYQLHHLLHSFADTILSDEERMSAQLRYAAHYKGVLEQADDLYLDGQQLAAFALFDREWSNIQAGQAWAAAYIMEDEQAAELCNDYPDAGAYVLAVRLLASEHMRWLKSALSAARKLQRRDTEALHLGNLGLAYMESGEPEQAIGFYKQALDLSRETKDRRAEGNLLGNLGLAYKSTNDVARAIEYFEQWLAIMREVDDKQGEGQALGNLGLAYAEVDQIEEAIACYKPRLELARELNDLRAEGNTLGYLGLAHARQGKWLTARELCEEWLAIARKVMDPQAEANALGNLGNIYVSLNELPQAIETYQRYQAMGRETDDRQILANAYGGLGIAYQKQGNAQFATDYYERWLSITREIGDQYGQTDALGNLGMLHQSEGNMARAIEYYEKALTIAQKSNDRYGEGSLLWNISLAFDTLGQRAKAITHVEQSLAIHEAIHDPWTPKVREKLAMWVGRG